MEYWLTQLSMKEIAAIIDTSTRTVESWKKRNSIPKYADRLLRLYQGELTLDVWEDEVEARLEKTVS